MRTSIKISRNDNQLNVQHDFTSSVSNKRKVILNRDFLFAPVTEVYHYCP